MTESEEIEKLNKQYQEKVFDMPDFEIEEDENIFDYDIDKY